MKPEIADIECMLKSLHELSKETEQAEFRILRRARERLVEIDAMTEEEEALVAAAPHSCARHRAILREREQLKLIISESERLLT